MHKPDPDLQAAVDWLSRMSDEECSGCEVHSSQRIYAYGVQGSKIRNHLRVRDNLIP